MYVISRFCRQKVNMTGISIWFEILFQNKIGEILRDFRADDTYQSVFFVFYMYVWVSWLGLFTKWRCFVKTQALSKDLVNICTSHNLKETLQYIKVSFTTHTK